MRKILPLLLLFLFLPGLLSITSPVFAAPSTIHAVLFISDTCEHCKDVVNYVLPPLVEKYANQLDIVGIQVNHPVGSDLFQSMLAAYNVPDQRIGVPTLVVGSTILVGTFEIESAFPEIIETGLAAGGIGWPDIPGLETLLAAQPDPAAQIAQTSETSKAFTAEENSGPIDRFMQDPLANTIAVIVLIGMLAAGAAVLVNYLQGSDRKFLEFPDWVLPTLVILGLGVAVYMTFVETTHTEAFCGPVGNCNTVQQSPYARLFGVLPVGLLGVAGYLAIFFGWLLVRFGPSQYRNFITLSIWGMGWFGLLFSIYLTVLEPFVIGTSCAWCISSAIIMTLILLAATEPANQVLRLESLDEADDPEYDPLLSAESE